MNGEAWCEPCGRQMVEYGRGSKLLAAIVLAAGMFGLYLLFDNLHFGLFSSRKVTGLVVLGLIVAGIAYRIAYPGTAGHGPTVVDRRRSRAPLPPLPAP